MQTHSGGCGGSLLFDQTLRMQSLLASQSAAFTVIQASLTDGGKIACFSEKCKFPAGLPLISISRAFVLLKASF